MAVAGWYADPADARAERWWDGQAWTAHQRPATQAPPTTQAPPATQVPPAPPQAPAPPRPPAQQPWTPYPGPGPAGPTVPAQRRRRRILPIAVAAVVVVLVVVGVVLYLVWPSGPTITYHGRDVAAPSTVLTRAEAAVSRTVRARHGVQSAQTRCYFARSASAPAGATDVEDTLRCGPVLFVDGAKRDNYLVVPLHASTTGDHAVLTPATDLDGIDPSPLGRGLHLVRPDGQAPPSGTAGLQVPQPPAAATDAVLATDLGSVTPPAALSHATMVSKYERVTLLAAGQVPRYGTGKDARSAPRGHRLIAFRIAYGAGQLGSSGTVRATVLIDGRARTIPATTGTQWDVAVVADGDSPRLQLADQGFTQTLTLPSGQPGSGNLTVLARTHTTGILGRTFGVPVVARKGTASAKATFRASASVATLQFWSPAHPDRHPARPDEALLTVGLTYVNSNEPGKTFGFGPQLLTLDLPGGHVLRAQNLAGKGKIYDVFTVPADFTSGTLRISGSEPIDGGATVHVTRTKSLSIRIAAG